MEYYSHQKQQHTTAQQQQQVNDGGARRISGPAIIINANNRNNNTKNFQNASNKNNISPTPSNIIIINSAAIKKTTTASPIDAATVAIAKDMLQLHHGSSGTSLNNSNNNNNSNTNNNSSTNNSNNNGRTVTALLEAMNASAPSITGQATGGNINNNNSTANATGSVTSNNNHPPAHASASDGGANANAAAPPDNALGFLKYDQELLYITEQCTVIGRNSSTSHVHFHVAENNLVSRKHFQVLYDGDAHDFFVQCLSKNGIFVDDFLQRRNADPLRLPVSCYFRFPSTEIRIQFESFVHGGNINNTSTTGSGISSITYHSNSQHHNNSVGTGGGNLATSAHIAILSPPPPDDPLPVHQQPSHHSHGGVGTASAHASQHGGISSHHHHHQQAQHHSHHVSSNAVSSSTHLIPQHMDNSNVYSPLKITIPKKEQKSPYLSPTGTISAANSCPASPRQNLNQNQATYNNYSNNNAQNQDLFQTPSTVSYNHNEKPPYSYAQLIVQAISAAPDKQLTLSGIYSFIVKHYPYYRKETNKGWQNSIRHNLSLNRYFIKVARSQDEPGKGSFWRIDPDSGAKLIDHSYKKRRQRSSQGFRPSYGMPRSAPVSPSHMDNSRESSPLQDFVLQSAPGSPGMSIEQRAADGDLAYNNAQHHQATANNSHNQYNRGSPYYVQQQQQQQHNDNSAAGNGVGALIALKRNHAMAAAGAQHQQQQKQHHQQQQQQVQTLHPDIIYEEIPTDYTGNMESGDEYILGGGSGGGSSDAAATTTAAGGKRPKYMSEAL